MHAQNKTPDSTLEPEIISKPKTDNLRSNLQSYAIFKFLNGLKEKKCGGRVNEKPTDSRKLGCTRTLVTIIIFTLLLSNMYTMENCAELQ